MADAIGTVAGNTGTTGAGAAGGDEASKLEQTFNKALEKANQTRAIVVEGQTKLDAAKKQPN